MASISISQPFVTTLMMGTERGPQQQPTSPLTHAASSRLSLAGKSSGWTKAPRAPHGPAAGQGEKLLQPPADLNNMHPGAGRKAKSLLAKEAVKMMTGLTVAGGVGGMVLGFISFFFFFLFF